MRLLEVFSDTISMVAESPGWPLSLDIDLKRCREIGVDILAFDRTQYPREYVDFIWASPECRACSGQEATQASNSRVTRTSQIIAYFNKAAWQRNTADGLLDTSVTQLWSETGHTMKQRLNAALARWPVQIWSEIRLQDRARLMARLEARRAPLLACLSQEWAPNVVRPIGRPRQRLHD